MNTQFNSYIIGSLRQHINNQWITIEQRAQMMFYLDQVHPLLQLIDQKGEVLYLSLKDLVSTAANSDAYAVVINHQGVFFGAEIHTVYSGGHPLPDLHQIKIKNEIIKRCEFHLNDMKNPFKLNVSSPFKPKQMDFENQFDCEFSVQIDETFKRFCGYASVAISGTTESQMKIGQKRNFIILDSEFSGVITQEVKPGLSFSTLDCERQLDVLLEDTEPSVTLQIKFAQEDQYRHFIKLLNETQMVAQINDQEIIYAPKNKIYQTEEYEQLEAEHGPKFAKKPNFIEVGKNRAIGSVDEIVYMFSDSKKQVELILKDAQKVTFAGRAKLDGDQTNLLAKKGEETVVLFDSVKEMASGELLHHVNKSNIKSEIADFSAGYQALNLVNSGLSSGNGLVGISHNSLFVIDRRIEPKQATVDESTLKQSKNYNLLLVTKQGHAAVAGDGGQISLFSKIGSRAVNVLPGCGYTVTAMSIDDDDQFLIATTEQQIVIYPLYGKDGTFAFKNTIKVTERDDARILQIQPTLRAQLKIKKIQLKPAFIAKNRLISGLQNYLLVWDFKKALLNDFSSIRKIKLDAGIIGGGVQEKMVVGTENGWDFVQ
ncbi:Conserved_hypothetical protein [Hexamita inflata]|uniref:Vacuolar import/degradation Vid27 C-terminal domain-containing protein n=1 Tax=Hexamita inflata TaxID=28002 RepID=A0AA86TAH9_9EUKA|nr:Conserved hypothetical protein [Hexamita inflata]